MSKFALSCLLLRCLTSQQSTSQDLLAVAIELTAVWNNVPLYYEQINNNSRRSFEKDMVLF